jgi:ABC-type nitrate/sulfonate/bicarbonate transport system substrate-binding protein
LIQTGSENEVLAALSNGAIDAGTMPPPLDARALTQNFRYVYVAYGPETAIPYPAANIVTRRPILEKRPAALGQFLRTMAEASKVLHTDRESSYKVLEKLFRVTDRKLIEHAYNSEIKVMERRLNVNLAGVQAVLEDTAKTDPRAAKVNAQELVDRRYLNEMERNGFFARL